MILHDKNCIHFWRITLVYAAKLLKAKGFMRHEVAGGMDQGGWALYVYDPDIIFENTQFVNQIVNMEIYSGVS